MRVLGKRSFMQSGVLRSCLARLANTRIAAHSARACLVVPDQAFRMQAVTVLPFFIILTLVGPDLLPFALKVLNFFF
jgi:hypothetical protein